VAEHELGGSQAPLPVAPADASAPSHAAVLEALRGRGIDRLDAHRFRLAEALARRAELQQGEARRVLDQKIEALVQALVAAAGSASHVTAEEGVSRDAASLARGSGPGPLASVLAHLAQHRAAPRAAEEAPTGMARDGAPAGPASARASPVDAQTLEFFRRTWSRLSAEQRLAQSRSALPGNAGPLNSQHVVHRALTSLRELSPAYFERFMNHVDALMWLDRAQEQAARQVGLPPRAKAAARKTPSTRRG
jgi:hypothetical protein